MSSLSLLAAAMRLHERGDSTREWLDQCFAFRSGRKLQNLQHHPPRNPSNGSIFFYRMEITTHACSVKVRKERIPMEAHEYLAFLKLSDRQARQAFFFLSLFPFYNRMIR